MIAGALPWVEPCGTSPDDMEPTMVTRHTAGGLARRRVISDAAAGLPTPPPQCPTLLPQADAPLKGRGAS